MSKNNENKDYSSDEIEEMYKKVVGKKPSKQARKSLKNAIIDEKIIWENMKRVNPIIGIFEGQAYVGKWFTIKRRLQLKKSEIDLSDFTERLYLITSNRKMIPYREKEFLEKGYRPQSKTGRFELEEQWNNKDVEHWIKNNPKRKSILICEGKLNAKNVYHEILYQIKRYMELPNEAWYDFVTLWIIGTYFHRLFNTYPYFYIGGVKQSGKTKLLDLIRLMAFNGIESCSISPASLFRSINAFAPTLCIDETERLYDAETNQIFRKILLEGYKKSGIVLRTGSQESGFKVEFFYVFCPKAIANIRGIEDVLGDRTIPLYIQRGLSEVINREINEKDYTWSQIRDLLYRLYLTEWNHIAIQYEDVDFEGGVKGVKGANQRGEKSEFLGSSSSSPNSPNSPIKARHRELWRPILALAQYFEREGNIAGLRDEIFKLASNITVQKLMEEITETVDMILIQVLYDLVDKDEWYSVKTIKEKLIENYCEGELAPKWLNSKFTGKALKRLGLSEKKKKHGLMHYHIKPEQTQNLMKRARIPLQTKLESKSIPIDEMIKPHSPVKAQTAQTAQKKLGECPLCQNPIKEKQDVRMYKDKIIFEGTKLCHVSCIEQNEELKK